MVVFTQAQAETVVKTMAKVSIDNEQWFSELDGVMGDGDFGTSLAAGFKAIVAGWDDFDKSSIGATLLKCATAITGNVGGCSGPVWGTMFMRMGMKLRGKTEATLEDVIAGLKSAIEGIMQRGGAKIGDKTLLDALDAIVMCNEASLSAGDDMAATLKKAAGAAFEMREISKPWVAKRGRQSFTGDRSAGTYDPGTVAVGEMMKAIEAALK